MKILASSSNHFTPILKALAAKEWEITTIHPQLAQSLNNIDVPAHPLINSGDSAIREQALNIASQINAGLHQRKYQDNGLLPPVEDFINNGYAGFVYADLPDIILFINLIDQYKPDVIILHNDVEQINRAAALWAKAYDVPCLHVPHAIYHNVENPYDIHRIVSAEYLASAGGYQSAWYVDCGMPPDHIYETGLPQFDKFATMPLDKRRSKAGLGIDQAQPVLCYTSSWRQDTNITGMHDGVMETYEAILECAKALPELKFVIKTHPHGKNASHHLKLAQEKGAEVVVTANHLAQCLMASDMLLAYGPSNTILEGAHIPWLRLACTSGYDGDNEILKIPTDPPDADMMVSQIKAAFNRPPFDYQRVRTKYLGLCDGNNHLRVTMLVERLAQRETVKNDGR